MNNATWQGKAEHVESGQTYHYKSFLELLTQIHHKLEILGYPQPDTQLRNWDENAFINMPSGTEQDQEEKPQSGGSTFFVRILYRQNTTWQGTVQSLDKKQTMPFRSLLELIMLINEAVSNSTEKST